MTPMNPSVASNCGVEARSGRRHRNEGILAFLAVPTQLPGAQPPHAALPFGTELAAGTMDLRGGPARYSSPTATHAYRKDTITAVGWVEQSETHHPAAGARV